jgi:hypothetical protein
MVKTFSKCGLPGSRLLLNVCIGFTRKGGYMARFDVVGICDECDGEILEQDCFELIEERLLCPECYEGAVTRGDINQDDDD